MSVVQAHFRRSHGVGFGHLPVASEPPRPASPPLRSQRGEAKSRPAADEIHFAVTREVRGAAPSGGQGNVNLSGQRFRVDALLGSGGVARVFRALDTWTNRRVALKAPGADGEREASVRQEASWLSKLRHPHVVRSFGLVNHGGRTCLAMEYCGGGSLARRFLDGSLSFFELLGVVADACCALEYVHQQGLLHLDIKPHNLLFTARGRLRLGDFGSAVDRCINPGGRPADESTVVTPYYMAPEQWAMTPVDKRTDVWALGMILHEGYFGVGAVPLGLGIATKFASRRRAFQRDGAPAGFARLLAKLLAPDPSERYQSAGDLRDALLSYRALVAR